MDDTIKNSDEVKMAKQAFISFHESNYVRFFKCVKNCSYLQGALLHRYFNQVSLKQIYEILDIKLNLLKYMIKNSLN